MIQSLNRVITWDIAKLLGIFQATLPVVEQISGQIFLWHFQNDKKSSHRKYDGSLL